MLGLSNINSYNYKSLEQYFSTRSFNFDGGDTKGRAKKILNGTGDFTVSFWIKINQHTPSMK